MSEDIHPPKWADRLLTWFCSEKVLESLQGDLHELYRKRRSSRGKFIANTYFLRDVLDVCRPFAIRSFKRPRLNRNVMLRNFFRIGWRNLLKNRGYSFINVGGFAVGMTVVMFIGLWVYDELSFNKYHKNYNEIAQVWSCSIDPEKQVITGGESIQYPVSITLRNNYSRYFKHVLIAWWPGDHTLSTDDKKFSRKGEFIESGAAEMLSLKMLQGSYESLNSAACIIISKSTARSIFGNDNPINKTLSIDGRKDVLVTGIYEDIPKNNRFSNIEFFSSWASWLSFNEWAREKKTDWDNRPFNIYVQLQPGVTMATANAAIKDLYSKNVPADFYKTMEKYKPFVQLIPMSTWHLYSEFKNGKPSGGRITYVWLFGTIGIFVLLLACINFINLSTARSEKRGREVGVRKALGSGKSQLILQFLSESMMVVIMAFLLSIGLVVLLKGLFNTLADKSIELPFGSPVFWISAMLFIGITGFIAGIYPAFYLSSFHPAKVLKGVFRSGRFSALPRKVLVVVQFTVSLVLIIGTLIVYQQIQFARNRPIGYSRNNLISLGMSDSNYKSKLGILKTELLRSGVVSEIAASSSPLTAIWNLTSGYKWPGKDPNLDAEFAICNVTPNFGKTVGWQFASGRDFSEDLKTDTTDAIIVNEAAVKYMGLKDPVGQKLTDIDEFGKEKWSRTIIGVVKDLIMESPYDPVVPTLYYFNKYASSILHLKINPAMPATAALQKIEGILSKIIPTALFDYKFVDEEYARKFSQEERIGKLSGVFSGLAIFISCLGLLGLASYVAERRTKELGIRKVVGASIFSLWKMLSKDFVVLVVISCLIAIPIAYYFLDDWLKNYQYRTSISWWVFFVAGTGALAITLLTVSFQAVKAAMMNPVKSLRSE